MAKVEFEESERSLGLKYSDLRPGQYILSSSGDVYVVIYDASSNTEPIIASVENPANTWHNMPGADTGFRLLTKGETFKVTI